MFYPTRNQTSDEAHSMTIDRKVPQALLDRLGPKNGNPEGGRTWRFSERMARVYQQQMDRFDDDEETRQWRRLYSVDNMLPPDDTLTMSEVAAQMAFYFPTHFFKFQKATTQQLLEWQSRQARLSPYPFGTPNITLIDIGAGVGTATLAVVDLLATWAEVCAELGYGQLRLSVRAVVVEPDTNKQSPRREMFAAMSSMLEEHAIQLERLTEILSPYPEPECIRQVFDAVASGSLAVCCVSDFLSSVPAYEQQRPVPVGVRDGVQSAKRGKATEGDQASILARKAVECGKASRYLLSNLPFHSRLLLASEVDEQRRTLQSFASSFLPSLELLVRRNRVKFYSPPGCYWYLLQNGDQSSNPDCAVNFWSLAHWNESSTAFA